jgi:hypothetical protein
LKALKALKTRSFTIIASTASANFYDHLRNVNKILVKVKSFYPTYSFIDAHDLKIQGEGP